MIAITYVGRAPEYVAKIKKKIYVFEWNKSVGIGKRKGEIGAWEATILAKRKDSKGRKLFVIE